LGYVFVFLLAGRSFRTQVFALGLILLGYTALFAAWPVPGADFDCANVGVPPSLPWYEGYFAHWNKNTNAAALFDLWFLNLFPRVSRLPPIAEVIRRSICAVAGDDDF
jgi:hypothetical protein